MSPLVESWTLSPRGIEGLVAWRETLRQVPAPSAIAQLSADVTISDATATDVTWDTEVQDNGNFFAPSSKFLIPAEEGVYLVGATIKWAGAGFAGRAYVRILHGSEIVAEHDDSTTGTTANSATISALIVAAKDDQIKVVVFQDATGTKDLEADVCRFWIVRVKAGL